MRKWLVLACVFTVTAANGQTATPAPPPPGLEPVIPLWAEIETVDARNAPGPAMWHLTRGNSEVWILGMIGTLPKGVTWNTQSLSEVMKGSRAMLTPPSADLGIGGVLSASWLLITNCCSPFRLESGKLDDLLPEATRVKLTSMRESVGGDNKLYQGDEPIRAAIRLNADYNKKFDLNGDNSVAAIYKLAGKLDLERQPASRFNPLPIVREALKVKAPQQIPCLNASMVDTERRAVHARPMAEAWAVGDIKALKTHYAESRLMECVAATVKSLGAMQQSEVPDMAAAIAAALEKPGKTFALVDIGPLLRKDGVLAQLEAKGLTIEGPPE